MLTLSHGLPANLAPKPRRGTERVIQAPASHFLHEGELNMGPAILLALTLSLLGWAGIIGALHLLRPLL